jgi:endonuclease/exonuclease/phosphatase family metal-dependent hydrolase
MQVKIGTFNLNNLFGRFNFKASIEEITPSGEYSFNPKDKYWIRKFVGKLVAPKDENETKQLAEMIRSSGVDVLAVQEVEDKDTLKRFNKEHLGGQYEYLTVIDGNDRRLIDVGILSKKPLGAITSWQFYPDPEIPDRPIFSRDLLQVEVLDDNRNFLFTFFITHLKSKFIPWQCKEECEEKQREEDNQKRLRQCEAIVEIVGREMGKNQPFVIAGDFNDTPDSDWLAPLLSNSLELENIVEQLPADDQWTYIHEDKKQQLDYILIPPAMLGAVQNPEIGECRPKVKAPEIPRCGSDHRPVFATLNL